jgi:hypothetical protein
MSARSGFSRPPRHACASAPTGTTSKTPRWRARRTIAATRRSRRRVALFVGHRLVAEDLVEDRLKLVTLELLGERGGDEGAQRGRSA